MSFASLAFLHLEPRRRPKEDAFGNQYAHFYTKNAADEQQELNGRCLLDPSWVPHSSPLLLLA
jgi:hypothetical protein